LQNLGIFQISSTPLAAVGYIDEIPLLAVPIRARAVTKADPITRWMVKLRDGNGQAAQALWDQYFERLAGYARRKLQHLPKRIADEEDIALSAMHSFCRGAAKGQYSRLQDRHDLWRLLATIAARKVHAQSRRSRAAKRGGGAVRGESVFSGADGAAPLGIDQVLGRAPTPELANMVVEEYQRLLIELGDATLRHVAQLKFEGYTSDEIAKKLNCIPSTVESKLQRIRQLWSK
jgi:DNA-directed RNA polymerase specialized sigma24 family protein